MSSSESDSQNLPVPLLDRENSDVMVAPDQSERSEVGLPTVPAVEQTKTPTYKRRVFLIGGAAIVFGGGLLTGLQFTGNNTSSTVLAEGQTIDGGNIDPNVEGTTQPMSSEQPTLAGEVELPSEETLTRSYGENIYGPWELGDDPPLAGIVIAPSDLDNARSTVFIKSEPLEERYVPVTLNQSPQDIVWQLESSRFYAFCQPLKETSWTTCEPDARILKYYYADLTSREYLRDLAAIAKIQDGHYKPFPYGFDYKLRAPELNIIKSTDTKLVASYSLYLEGYDLSGREDPEDIQVSKVKSTFILKDGHWLLESKDVLKTSS